MKATTCFVPASVAIGPADTFAAHGAAPDLAVRDYAEFLRGPGAWLRG